MLKYCTLLGKIHGPIELKSYSSKQQHQSQKARARKHNNDAQKLQLQLQEKKLELKAPALTLNLILESKSSSSNSDLILGSFIPDRLKILIGGTPQPHQPQHTGGKRQKNPSLIPHTELRPRPRKGSNKPFTKLIFFKIPDLVHRAAPAAIVGEYRR